MTTSGAHAGAGPLPGRPRLLPARGVRRVTWAAAAAMLTLSLLLFLLPNDSLVVTAFLLGIAIVVTGLLRLVRSASPGAGGHRGTHLLVGLLATLAGLFCLDHISTVVLLSLVAGLFWAVHGLADLVIASSGGPGRGVLAVTGTLGLLAGLTVIFWPAIPLTVLVAVMGGWLACDGVLLAVTALALRRAARAGSRRGLPVLMIADDHRAFPGPGLKGLSQRLT